MVDVSAVIITLNEESCIEKALRSISWCSEIIVVDSGSTDRTVEICKSYGCKVIHRDFSGFGDQKRFAVRQAKANWVLSLDADEVVTPELSQEIQVELSRNGNGETRAYHIPITLVLWDGLIRRRNRLTKPKLRLFDQRFAGFTDDYVHESVVTSRQSKQLRSPIYHYSYATISDYFQKFNLYTSLAAEHRAKAARKFSVVKSLVRFPFEFFKLYVVRGFVLDGWCGFAWALFSALYPVVKNLKTHEHLQAGLQVERSVTSGSIPSYVLSRRFSKSTPERTATSGI